MLSTLISKKPSQSFYFLSLSLSLPHQIHKHNVLIMSHGIVGSNRQTSLTKPNKCPHTEIEDRIV